MSAVSGTDQDILHLGPPTIDYYLAILPRNSLFACSLNMAAATWGETTLPYDSVTQGAWGNVIIDQTLLVFSSIGAYKGKVRLRSIDAAEIVVAANYDIEWADDDLLYAIDVFEPWARPTRVIDEGPGLGFQYYKDTDIAWVSNAYAFRPKANGGVADARFLGPGGFVDVEFGGPGWSFATADGATITTHNWDIADGAFQVGNAASEQITARFSSAQFRWIHYTVTDSNGMASVHHIPVWTFGGNYQPLTEFSIKRRSSDGRDWELQIEAFGDDLTQPAEIPEGTMMVLFVREYIDGSEVTTDMSCPFPGRQHIRMVGWVLEDTVRFDPETGVVDFTIGTIGKVADNLRGFPTFLVDKPAGEASNWHEGEGLTVQSAIYFLWRWHTNLPSLAYMEIEPTDLIAGRKFRRNAPFKQVEGDLLLRCFTKLGCTRWGSVHCRYDPQIQSPADRAAVATTMDLAARDWWTELSFGYSNHPLLSAIHGGGIAYGGITGVPYRARSPGQIGRESSKITRADNLIISSQDDLNDKLGRLLAARSNQQEEITIESGYDIWEPAFQEYLTITVAAADNPRARAFDTSDQWIVRRIEIEDIMGDTPTARVTAELLMPEDTAIGTEVPIPQPPELPDPDIPDPLPPLEPPEEDGTGEHVLVSGEGGCAYTLNAISGNPPTWAALNGGLGDASFVSALCNDPLASERAWCIDGAGTVARHDNWTAGGNWTPILTEAAALTLIETAVGSTPDDVDNVDVKAFNLGDTTYLYVVCQIEWSFADHRVRILRSTDAGASWSVGGPIPGFDLGPFTESWEYTRKTGESGWGELAYDPISQKLWMACRSPRYGGYGGRSCLNSSVDAGVTWQVSAIIGGSDHEDYVGPACADVTSAGQLFVVPWKDIPDRGYCDATAFYNHAGAYCCAGASLNSPGDTCAVPTTGWYEVSAIAQVGALECPLHPGHDCGNIIPTVSANYNGGAVFLFLGVHNSYTGIHWITAGTFLRFIVTGFGATSCCYFVDGSLSLFLVGEPSVWEGDWMVGAATDPAVEADIQEVKELEADDGYARYRGMLDLLADDSWAALQIETPGTRISQTRLEVNGALQITFEHPYRTVYGYPLNAWTMYIGRSWLDDEEANITHPQLFGLSLTKGSSWADKSGNLYTLGQRSITGIVADLGSD